jgi:hypothetical protein
MALHTYRYQWLGVTKMYLDELLDPAFPSTFIDFGPEILQDVEVDDSQKSSLDAAMAQQGWSFVEADPLTAIPQAFASFQFSGTVVNGVFGLADAGVDLSVPQLIRAVNYPYSGPNTVLNTIGIMLADALVTGTITFDVLINGGIVATVPVGPGPLPLPIKIVQAFAVPAPLITSAHVEIRVTAAGLPAVGLGSTIGVSATVTTGN